MKITKQQKMLLGVGVVAVAGYFIWKQNQEKQNFIRRRPMGMPNRSTLMTKYGEAIGDGFGRPRPTIIIPPQESTMRFFPNGCPSGKGRCRDVDNNGNPTGYIYCAGVDKKGNQNFATKIQGDDDGSQAAALPTC